VKKKFKVNFDICTYCNHGCTFCSNADAKTPKDKVKFKDYVSVMDNLVKHIDISELALSAKGEVLMNHDLEKIIVQSKKIYKVPYLYFSTNGYYLDAKRANSILEAGIDSIKFSINATDKEAYQKIHLKDDFERVIKHLKYLILLKKSQYKELKIFISIVTNEPKNDVLKAFEKLLGALDAINDIFVYKLQYRPHQGGIEIDTSKVIIDNSNCLISPLKEIYVNSDCSLGFCCLDYFDEINFGSLLEDDFMKLYEGAEYKNMRQRFIENNFPKESLCYNCLAFEGLNKKVSS